MRKLLVANRGEIACRIMRTARAMGIATAAVYSAADRRALHVEAADEAVPLPGSSPADTYLSADAMLEAARRTGADAVHPGYGFLAENAKLARSCVDAGIIFVGPPAEVIAAMGDKLEAKALMGSAGVPVLEVLEASSVPEDAYPVLVKAARGGGGKGMRVVGNPDELPEALAAARRESAAAFGDDTVFVERYLERPRHVEVQILGDDHGRIVHLGERDCSIQRRHQKVIEESPAPALDERLRGALRAAAVAAGEALGYRNAGTVEFVVTPDGAFAFLEVNTRLQVEHPVTEHAWAANGEPLDLVRLQLTIARGEPLTFRQSDVRPVAHAIEARLYAEDPANDFLPAAGTLVVFDPDAGVRWDTGVRAGDEISIHYDPLLAKVIVAAPTRTEAAARLAAALERSRIHGVTTNRDLLVAALRHRAFLDGRVHTDFIGEHLGDRRLALQPETTALHAAAAALVACRRRTLRAGAPPPTLPPAWRNNRSQGQRISYRTAEGAVDVEYMPHRDGSWSVRAGEESLRVQVVGWPDDRPDGALDAEFGGRRLRVAVTERSGVAYVDSVLGHTELEELPRFPDPSEDEGHAGLVAPMPATVVSVAAAEGDVVDGGALLVVLEAMKMEHRITAPDRGAVREVRVSPGQGVAAGDVLLVLDEA